MKALKINRCLIKNNHKLFLLKKPLRSFSDLNGFLSIHQDQISFSMIQSIRPLLHDYVFGH